MRILALSILMAIPLAQALACSCAFNPAGNSPCQAGWEAAAAFTGTVLDIIEPAPPASIPAPQDGGRSSARRTVNDPPLPAVFPKREVRLLVGAVLNGVGPGPSEITVLTGLGGGDC